MNFIVSSNHKGVIFFRTFTPDHFENMEWFNGGTCHRTTPIKSDMEMKYLSKMLRDVELDEVGKAASEASKNGVNLKLVDIASLSLLRPDGHPGPYRQFHPFENDQNASKVQNYCLHWCLPGPIDSWNDIIMDGCQWVWVRISPNIRHLICRISSLNLFINGCWYVFTKLNNNFFSMSIISQNCYLCILLALFRRLNSVAEINDSKETWKIAIRVLSMWTIPRSPKSTIELKVIDKDGDQIIAQMKNIDDKVLNVNFQIGETYVIQNFEIEKNVGQYKATRHAFKINLVKATKVTAHDMPEIPNTMYSFTMFDAIQNGSASPDYLIDVIGEVVQISQWNLDGKPKKVVFTMKDQCGNAINCTLWESLAMEFKDYFEKAVVGPFILILTMAKIKEARGNYPIGIQNSMYGSKIFVNNDNKEILEFKDRMDPSQLTTNTCSQIGSQLTGSSLYSVADRFLHKAFVKSIDQLTQLKKDDICVTVATISKLLVANGWIYESCPKCNKKVDPVALPFICVACGNESRNTNPRFRVDVSVSQSGESAIFTLWDRECVALIEETAADIKQKMISEEGEFDARDIPEALDRVLGKTCAFRFKFIPGNTRHSISQLSEDDGLINAVLAKLSTSALPIDPEPSSSIASHCNDLLDSQCFSVTAESDPNLLSSITPSKRISPNTDTLLEGMEFEDLSQIQLSCTRLKKHIKKE